MKKTGVKKEGAKLDALMGFLLLLLLALTAWIANDKSVFNEGFPLVDMSGMETLLSFFAYVGLAGLFLALSFKSRPWRPNVPFLILCLVFLSCGLLSIYSFPSHPSYFNGDQTFFFSWGAGEKTQSALGFLCGVSTFYLLFDPGCKVCDAKSILRFFCWGYLGFCLVCIVYSLCVEWKEYEELFTLLASGHYEYRSLVSFLYNRNTFALALFIGIVSCGYLNNDRPRFFYYIIALILYFWIGLTMSRTGFLVSSAFSLFYCLYRFFLTLRSHPLRNGLAMGIGVSALVVCLALSFVPLNESGDVFAKKAFHFLVKNLGQVDTAKGRALTWTVAFSQFDSPWRLLFGFGFRNADHYIRFLTLCAFGDALPMDGGFTDCLFRYGIVGLLFLIAGFGFFLYCGIDNASKKSRTSLCCLLAGFCFGFHSLSEVSHAFLFTAPSLCFLLLSSYPVFAEWMERRHPKETEEKEPNVPLTSPSQKASLVLALFMPLGICFCLSAPYFGLYYGITKLTEVPFYLSVLAFLLVFGFACYFLCLPFRQKRKALFAGISLLLFAGFFLLALLLPGWFALFSLLPLLGEALLTFLWIKKGRTILPFPSFRKIIAPFGIALVLTLTSLSLPLAFLFPPHMSRYALIALVFASFLDYLFFFCLFLGAKRDPLLGFFIPLERKRREKEGVREKKRARRMELDTMSAPLRKEEEKKAKGS